MTPEEKKIIELQMVAAARICRGHVLQATTELEVLIDHYLTNYFCEGSQKQEEFWMLILNPSVGLTAKHTLLKYLFDNYEPNHEQQYPQLFPAIRKIIEERNVFAHWPITFSDDAVEKFMKTNQILFMKLKKGFDKKEQKTHLGWEYHFSEERLNALLSIINEAVKALRAITKMDVESPAK